MDKKNTKSTYGEIDSNNQLTKYKRKIKTCLNITTSASTHVCISVHKRALKKLINTTNVCLVQSKNLFEQVLLCRELVC